MRRPLGITVLSIAHLLLGGLTIFTALFSSLFLFIDITPDMVNEGFDNILPKGIGMAFNTLILFIVGISVVATGIGLIEGWSWIWYVEVLLMTALLLNIIFLSVSTISSLFITIFPVVILYYLSRSYVKEFFLGLEDLEEDEYINNSRDI